jgi:hypothetical protein
MVRRFTCSSLSYRHEALPSSPAAERIFGVAMQFHIRNHKKRDTQQKTKKKKKILFIVLARR